MLLLNPRRTRTNMKLLQLVWIFLLTLCGQSGVTAITVKENDDVILDCSFGATNIEKKPFTWKKDVDKSNEEVFWYSGGTTDPGKEFRGRVSYFPDQLRFGNASIKITKAKTSDSGTYTCYHATVKKEIKSNISLTVDPILKPRPEIEGASPKPFIETLSVTNNQVQLQCVVRGAFPEPEVVWMDSDGTTLRADDKPKVTKIEGNKSDTILRITVTKTDNYTCVATQKTIHHQINGTTEVRLNGGASKPVAKAIEHTKDGMLLQCVVQDPSPELKVFWKDKSGNTIPSKEPQKTENSIILQTTVTQTNDYRCVTTEGKKDDEVSDEIHVVVPGDTSNNSISGVVGIVVGSVIGLIGIVAAVVALYLRKRDKQRFRGSSTDGSIGKNESQAPLKQDV